MNDRKIAFGNAYEDGKPYRSWFIGSFIEGDEIRNRNEIEVKWRLHTAGEKREQWSYSRTAKSFTMLIYGKWLQEYPDQKVELVSPGDYTMWDAFVPHKWQALEDSVMLAIRWPSIPGDIVNIEDPTQVEPH